MVDGQGRIILHIKVICCVRDVCTSFFCVCILVNELVLRGFAGQVGNQRSDGADVRYDSENDGEHGEPQSLARCSVGPLKIPLSRGLVGL